MTEIELTETLQGILNEIWCEILGIDDIAIDSNFFEIGGDSLLATRIFVCVRDRFEGDIELRALFDFPTIREFCQYLKGTLAFSGED